MVDALIWCDLDLHRCPRGLHQKRPAVKVKKLSEVTGTQKDRTAHKLQKAEENVCGIVQHTGGVSGVLLFVHSF